MARTLHVLIIEDSADDAELLSGELRRGGFDPRCTQVETDEALRLALAAQPWQIVLSDYRLPGFGAEAALSIVRAADPDLPFLVVSGAVGEEYAARLMRAGASDFVLKQNLSRLPAAIERELRQAEHRRARRQAEAKQVETLDDLQERLKELTALRKAAGLLRQEAIPVPVLLQEFVDLLPPAVRYPEVAAARVLIEGREVCTANFEHSPIRLAATFGTANGQQGTLEIVYRNGSPDPVDRPFLVEEQRMLAALAEMLGSHLDRLQAEAEVRKSERRYRLLFNSTPHPMWVYDRSCLRFIDVNEAAVAHYGYSREQFLKLTLRDIRPAEDVAALEEAVQNLQTGGIFTRLTRHQTRDGRIIQVEITAHGVELEGVQAAIVLAQDVTARMAAEEENRRTARLLQAVAENTPDAIFVKDRAGKYLLCNRATAQFIGRPEAEILGRDDAALFGPASARTIMVRDRQVMDGHRATTEEEQLDVDGTTRTFLATKAPLKDSNGNVVGLIGISRDVTDRKQMEEKLRLRDRAISAATQGIVITDPTQADNPIIYVSPGFERLTGYSSGELVGRNCRVLQGPDSDPEVRTRIRQALRAEEPLTVEILNYRKDGTPFWNELSISPVRDAAGQLSHFVGIQNDITGRRRLEQQVQQSQKMEAVGQLAGGIAHDFNNLLTIINGYSESLLEQTPPDAPEWEPLEEIRIAGERSANLTRQLLAFSRRQILALEILDLNAVVRGTETMLRRLIGEDIEFTTKLAAGVLPVKADSGQLEQILLNFAVNARDAMPGGGRLTIETRNVELDEKHARMHLESAPGNYAMLAVSDTGCGISPDVLPRVFEPFFTTKKSGCGTGLGLSVVHGIVRQLGGYVDVLSEPGSGSSFRAYLPCRREALSRVEESVDPQALPEGTERVLLVEDEESLRALTKKTLQRCGYTVLDASNGEATTRLINSSDGPIDLLVTDVVMPGESGPQIAGRLSKQFPAMRVLFISGYTNDTVVRHGVLQNRVDFLQKPFTATQLAKKVREVLDAPGL